MAGARRLATAAAVAMEEARRLAADFVMHGTAQATSGKRMV